jgi:hypothetical protein
VTLVVGDDLDTAVLVHTDARVGGSKICWIQKKREGLVV